MKIYDAICRNEKFRERMPAIIDDLIENPEESRRRLKSEAGKGDSLVAHALRILVALSEKGNTAILAQMRDANTRVIMDDPVEAIVLQMMASDRWSKEFGESTYDLVLALPQWSNVIAISTTEAEIPTDPIIPRLDKVRLENVHLYSFFNRAHAVRGRRVSSVKKHNNDPINLNQFKPFMRTCKDIETIGNGLALRYFTPFFTEEGLRLGFFFALICRATSVDCIPSTTGFGVTPDQVALTLSDYSGCLKARLNTEIFRESLNNPKQRTDTKLKDPMDLNDFKGSILIVGVWMLGRDYPEIAFLGLLGDDFEPATWEALSYMNSHRKLSLGYIQGILDENQVDKACRNTGCVIKTKDWVYYKEESWPTEIFLAMEENGFPYELSLPDALKHNASHWTWKVWSKQIRRFFRINPHLLELYRSKVPLDMFRKMHEFSEKEKEAAAKLTVHVEEKVVLIPFSSRERSKILNVSRSLSTLGYTAWDLFSPEWKNGGYALERRWLHLRSRQKQVLLDEMTSALLFILSMRGEVRIPREAISRLD
jgi:hypothetical protein